MPEQITNGFDTDPFLEQAHGKAVAQSVWGTAVERQTTLLGASSEHRADRCSRQRTDGGKDSEEQLSAFGVGASTAQVALEHGSRLHRYRQYQSGARLVLGHMEFACLPVD
jgi:hypothetical protein